MNAWQRRSLGLTAALSVIVPLVALPTAALADGAGAERAVTEQVKITQSNWYWDSGFALPVEVPVPLPVPIPENPIPAGILIPNGDFAVSSTTGAVTGDPDRETFLLFDVGHANDTAKVKSFTFTLAVDTANLTNTPGSAQLVACYPSRLWDAGAGSTGVSQRPMVDCSDAPVAVYDADKKTYTFTVTKYAQDWVEGTNLGVAIHQGPKQVTPFIVAFKGASDVKASISYLQGAGGAVVPNVTPPSVPVEVPDLTPELPVTEPVTDVSIPVAPTVPSVGSNPASAPTVFTAADGSRSIGSTSYDSDFWLSLVAAAAGLIVVAWFMRRRPAIVVDSAPTSRLSQVLARRTRAAATSQ